MSERYFYKHAVTDEVAEMSERFAAVFGDTLTRVDRDGNPVKARSTKKRSDAEATDTNTDSPKEGNN